MPDMFLYVCVCVYACVCVCMCNHACLNVFILLGVSAGVLCTCVTNCVGVCVRNYASVYLCQQVFSATAIHSKLILP